MNSHEDRLKRLRALRLFQGREGEFWLSYAEEACRFFVADRVLLLRKSSSGWNSFCFWPLASARSGMVDSTLLNQVVEQTVQQPLVYLPLSPDNDAAASGILVAFRLECTPDDAETIALFFRTTDQTTESDRSSDVLKREVLFNIPAAYRTGSTTRALSRDVQGMPDPLDVMLSMNEHAGFLGVAMALCNELAYRFSASRVTLGWKEGEYIRLQALSNTEKFDRKMAVVQALEVVMEECLDQDEELLLPEPAGSTAVLREHKNFAARQGVTNMVSLPLRIEQSAVAVLTCERDKPFSADEIRSLRIICDQASRRLADLKHYDRWFGAVALDALQRWGSSVFGTDQTLHRIYGVAASLLLAVLLFGTIEYRVEAPFILRTKDLALLSAPFDGYIEQVNRKPGDLVAANQPLLRLDTRQLVLEQSRGYADLQRYVQEEKKAMAHNALGEMKIAEALKRQAESRFEMIRYSLDHAEIKAPFSGVVVEGDLEKLLGAPVRKGDVLLKVAKLEELYVEMKVPERDIQELNVGQVGEVAFLSQPGKKFELLIERIEPMAVTEQKGNVFLVLGKITEVRQSWWRPGMSGLVKVNVGKRHIIWIMLHRTFDFFSMKLWW